MEYVGGGVDYSSGPYIVQFDAGVTRMSFNVPIINDVLLESNETFTLSINQISLPESVTLVDPDQTTVTIVANDCKYKLLIMCFFQKHLSPHICLLYCVVLYYVATVHSKTHMRKTVLCNFVKQSVYISTGLDTVFVYCCRRTVLQSYTTLSFTYGFVVVMSRLVPSQPACNKFLLLMMHATLNVKFPL